MRLLLALLLAATLAAAEDDAQLARTVDALVRDLGAPSADVRTLARFRLASYGESIRSLLERVRSDDPEVRRAIRDLTRTPGKVEIEILPRTDTPLPIGATLVLEVRMINSTEQTIYLLPTAARQAGIAPFYVRVGGKTLPPFGIDQVNWGSDGAATILPGATRRFRLEVGGATSPLRRPGLYDVSVLFDGFVARGYGALEALGRLSGAEGEGAVENAPLRVESAPIQVNVLGRKAEDLEKALGSKEVRERNAALAELSMRDDEAVVPVLRRHAQERSLRLAAVRALGQLGWEEDFNLIFEATRDEDAAVRRAAVLGLGKYKRTKARSRLLLLASDNELQTEAIRALRGHKHHATIDCFLKLLGTNRCSPADSRYIRAVLFEWTDRAVDARPSQIEAFRAWWEANRVEWARENASGK